MTKTCRELTDGECTVSVEIDDAGVPMRVLGAFWLRTRVPAAIEWSERDIFLTARNPVAAVDALLAAGWFWLDRPDCNMTVSEAIAAAHRDGVAAADKNAAVKKDDAAADGA